jgi:hypothetical protein
MKPLHDLFAFSLVAISLLGSLPTHASPIVGGWYGTHLGQADSTAVITFLADGSYWMAEDGSSVLDPSGQDGMERGTYTWNPLTSAFSSTTLVDTSGQWGLSHSGLTSIGISGDTMTIAGRRHAESRNQPNQRHCRLLVCHRWRTSCQHGAYHFPV